MSGVKQISIASAYAIQSRSAGVNCHKRLQSPYFPVMFSIRGTFGLA
jgi:hypothetical protein